MKRKFAFLLTVALLIWTVIPIAVSNAADDPEVTFTDSFIQSSIARMVGKSVTDAVYQSDLQYLVDHAASKEITINPTRVGITSLEGLENFAGTGIQGLKIILPNNKYQAPDNVDLAPLKDLTSLTTLQLQYVTVSDISPLANLTNLTTLYLTGNKNISTLSPLTGITGLQKLIVSGNSILDITPISGLTNLQQLSLNGNQLSDLTPLQNLTKLKDLSLSENQINDISPINSLHALQHLEIKSNPDLTNLAPLAGLNNLNYLVASGINAIDLTPLSSLTSLRTFEMAGSNIKDISPLSGLPQLSILFIHANDITDMSPLATIPSLTSISIQNNFADIYSEPQNSIISSLPGSVIKNFQIKLATIDVN